MTVADMLTCLEDKISMFENNYNVPIRILRYLQNLNSIVHTTDCHILFDTVDEYYPFSG